MRRMKTVGLCLVAVFALAAVAGVSSASAAEYGVCVSFKMGKYSDPNCQVEDLKKGKPKGTFEFETADSCFAEKKGRYSGPSCTERDEKKGKPKGSWELAASPMIHAESGLVTLETPGVGNIQCTHSVTTGQITGAKTNLEQAVFFQCEGNGAPCENTPLSPSGEIQTYELETTLEEPSVGVAETWFENSALTGHPYSSVYFCNGFATFVRTKGSIGGVTTPTNVMGTASTTVFSHTSHQALLTEFYCSPGTGEPWSGEAGATECPANGEPYYGPGTAPAGGEFFSEEILTGSTTTTPAMEIRTCGPCLTFTANLGPGRENETECHNRFANGHCLVTVTNPAADAEDVRLAAPTINNGKFVIVPTPVKPPPECVNGTVLKGGQSCLVETEVNGAPAPGEWTGKLMITGRGVTTGQAVTIEVKLEAT
jgi:hypothetical protein